MSEKLNRRFWLTSSPGGSLHPLPLNSADGWAKAWGVEISVRRKSFVQARC